MEDIKKLDETTEANVVGGMESGFSPSTNAACPRCSSTDVTYYGRDPLTGYNEYQCNSCGYHWETMD